MGCKKLREVLDLYVDHELSPDALAQIHLHIAECSACRRAVECLFRLREGMKAAVGIPELSPELSERLRAMISPPWYRAAALRAIAATLAVAVILALFVPTVRGDAANALDFLSFKLDGTLRQFTVIVALAPHLSLLGQIEALEAGIAELEGAITGVAQSLPGHGNLVSVKGVGSLSAAILLSGIGPLEDFADPGRLAAYFGLVPHKQHGRFFASLRMTA